MSISKDIKPKDMSVEDILKSIRGIIDNHNPVQKKKPEEEDDILELTNIVAHEEKNNDADDSEPLHLTRQATHASSSHKDPVMQAEDISQLLRNSKQALDWVNNSQNEHLVSEKSASAASNLFKDFAEKVHTMREGKRNKPTTVEEFVIDLMRPQLSKWLDEHLPALVSELVEKEIRRLVQNDDIID